MTRSTPRERKSAAMDLSDTSSTMNGSRWSDNSTAPRGSTLIHSGKAGVWSWLVAFDVIVICPHSVVCTGAHSTCLPGAVPASKSFTIPAVSEDPQQDQEDREHTAHD